MTVRREKWIIVTLTCMILAGLPLMDTVTVQAPDWLFTINLVVAYEDAPHWDMASAFKTELAKLGINVELRYMDAGTYYDVVWDTGWNKTWDQGGWDMDLSTFMWLPTDLVWFEGCYSAAGHPPYGWNYFGWQNEKADWLLRKCMSTVDPELRKDYIWMWQDEFMHDPPHATVFYPTYYEIVDADLEGWDFIRWWYDTDDLKLAGTSLEDDVTLHYGSAEDLLTLNPVFTLSLGSETFTDQIFDMLLKTSKDPVTGKAILKPSLARELPTYSPDGMRATVYLRENVTWHDGWRFNATDVKFTFDAVIDSATWSSGYGDFAPVIDWVEIVDEFTVVFHFKQPAPHFNTLLADDYGALIIPEHILRGIPHRQWRRHVTNTETPMPGTGRWKFVSWVRDEYWLVEKNPDYFLGEPMIDTIYNWIITNPSAGLVALQNHEIHFGDCWAATMDEIRTINQTDPTLKVTEEPYPAMQFFGFNLHHPILSNRYVRQAIACAIPYEHIINDILPSLGGSGIRATAAVNPLHGAFYNTEIEPNEYNLTRAQQYLDMWRYSQVGTDYTRGPKGDADFSGYVELPDFYIWVDNFGTSPADWPFSAGRPIDPDWDNSGYVEMPDFYRWREAWGTEYPFPGAR